MGIAGLLGLTVGRPPTSAELAEASARAEAAGKAAGERLVELTRQRGDALVAGDDPALDRIEAELAKVQREADRAELLVAELGRRREEARAAAARAEVDALHERGLAAQRKGVDLIRNRYAKLARPMAALADELFDLMNEVDAVNAALAKAGDPRRVEIVETAARPRAGLGDPGRFADNFLMALSLPSPESPVRSLWPPRGQA